MANEEALIIGPFSSSSLIRIMPNPALPYPSTLSTIPMYLGRYPGIEVLILFSLQAHLHPHRSFCLIRPLP